MTAYEFTLVVDRDGTDEAIADALFEIDHGDSVPEGGPNGPNLVHVHRDADTMSEAIADAVHAVESVGLVVLGLDSDDLVSGKDIAHRLDRSYESVRKWAAGERGPGSFPLPVAGGQWALYSWAEVCAWLRHHQLAPGVEVDDYGRKIAAANHVLRARHMAQASEIGGLATLINA